MLSSCWILRNRCGLRRPGSSAMVRWDRYQEIRRALGMPVGAGSKALKFMVDAAKGEAALKYFGLLCFALFSVAAPAQQYTRGLGVYPGDPRQYDGPVLAADASSYRNLALHRPAYQSSAYDYNLTAQPVTDGIREHALPERVVTSTSDHGQLSKTE